MFCRLLSSPTYDVIITSQVAAVWGEITPVKQENKDPGQKNEYTQMTSFVCEHHTITTHSIHKEEVKGHPSGVSGEKTPSSSLINKSINITLNGNYLDVQIIVFIHL